MDRRHIELNKIKKDLHEHLKELKVNNFFFSFFILSFKISFSLYIYYYYIKLNFNFKI